MHLKKYIITIIFIVALFLTQNVKAIEYPIMFLGGNVGYGQNDLKSGLAIKGAFRYSLEAYIPGLQIETSYSTTLFQALQDTTIKLDNDDENIYQTKIGDHQIGLSALLNLHPFGKSSAVFIGGGGNINFIKADSSWTEKYWDPVAEDFQELKHDPVNLLQEAVPGFHVFGGLRFALGKFGTFDIEVRKTFLNVDESAWKVDRFRKQYGEKKWDSLNFNVGMTFFIF